MNNCPYKILGIRKKSSQPTIKKAFRKLVKQLHPDINKTTNNDRLIEITEAYKYLSDPILKKEYDESGVLKNVKEEFIIRQSAINNLSNLFISVIQHDQFISNPSSVDLLESISNLISQNIKNLESSQSKIEKLLNSTQVVKNNLTIKNDCDDFLGDVVISLIKNKNNELEQIKRDIKILLKMKEMLSYYSYNFIKLNIPTGFVNYSTSSTYTF